MATQARPRRSMLYMPGSNARALEKARTLAADALILDLEDSVAPEVKETARAQVCEAVKTGGYGGREILIRVNGLATPWGQADVTAAARAGAHGILLPKVESADMVRQAESILIENGAPDDLAIWCMMETPRGMLHAEAIADASARMGGFVLGTSDLAKDLHCAHTPMRLPMITALGLCLLAARAANIAVLDGVYLDLGDAEGFAAACRQGVEMGFDGKTVIHPKQLAPANQAFAPDTAAIEWSYRIIEAHEAAAKAGQGVVTVDGKLIENLHVADAHRLLGLAAAIKELEAATP